MRTLLVNGLTSVERIFRQSFYSCHGWVDCTEFACCPTRSSGQQSLHHARPADNAAVQPHLCSSSLAASEPCHCNIDLHHIDCDYQYMLSFYVYCAWPRQRWLANLENTSTNCYHLIYMLLLLTRGSLLTKTTLQKQIKRKKRKKWKHIQNITATASAAENRKLH